MTRSALIVTLVLSVIAVMGQAPVMAQTSVTVHGGIVELTSYVTSGIMPTTAAGREIALASIGKGGAMAIVEKGTKRIYILAGAPQDTSFVQNVSAYFGVKAFVKGKRYLKSGVRVLTVEDIGKSLK